MASVYALRLFIGAMHNRVGPKVESREISVRDGLVLVPLVLVILALALYPQFALHRSEGSVKGAVFEAQALAHNPNAQFHYFDRHGEHRRDREHRTMNYTAALLTRDRHGHLKGPHVDFAGLSPLIALLGGAVIVLLVGLLGSREAREQAVPALSLVVLGASLGLTIWQWGDAEVDRRRRAARWTTWRSC